MWTRRAFAGLAAGAAMAATGAEARAARPSRRGEADAIRRFAETTHPRGLEAAADTVWRKGWDELSRRADKLTDGAYVAALRKGLAWFRDGHTNLLPFEFLPAVPDAMKTGPFGIAPPLKVEAFDDGLWVVAAKSDAAPLLGARVHFINGVSDSELMRRLADGWAGNNPAWAHRWASLLTSSVGTLQGLGVIHADAAAPVIVEARTVDGESRVARLTPRADGLADRAPLTRPMSDRETWAAEAKVGNYLKVLPKKKALYVSIDDMADVEGMTFLDLSRAVFKAMESPAVERIVIDLRRNGGGNNFLGEGLRKHIERSRFNRPGALYVLTSPQTFSAAQNLANRLERETFALFVGGPTGGAPNHYGDAKLLTGEVTGVVAMVSTIPWFDSYPMDTRPWILPDLPVAATFADWAAGRDPALDLALSHTGGGEAKDLSRARVFYYERDSQKADWKPFWRT